MKHIKVKTALKAGRITANHARNALGDPYRRPRDPNAHVLSNDLVEEPHGVLALDRKVDTVVIHRSWTVRTCANGRRSSPENSLATDRLRRPPECSRESVVRSGRVELPQS